MIWKSGEPWTLSQRVSEAHKGSLINDVQVGPWAGGQQGPGLGLDIHVPGLSESRYHF